MQVLKPKGSGAGLMVSDFIEERDGCLALSTAMHQAISEKDSSIPLSARVTLEIEGKVMMAIGTMRDLWSRWKLH